MAVLPPEQQRQVAATIDFDNTTAKEVRGIVSEVRNSNGARDHRAKGTGDEHTPAEIIEAAQDVLEIIELDPASSAIANENVKAERIFTEDDDGLRKAWRAETLFLNPPKPLISQFIEKLLDAMETGNVKESIALLRDPSDAAWFQRAGEVARAICLAPGRTDIFYFGPNGDRFADRFESIGLVVTPYGIRCDGAETSLSSDKQPIVEAIKQGGTQSPVEPNSPAVERVYVSDDDGRYQVNDDQVLKGDL